MIKVRSWMLKWGAPDSSRPCIVARSYFCTRFWFSGFRSVLR